MTPATLDLARFELPALLDGCVENLLSVYNENLALFPYATRLVDGRFVNEYSHPQAIRYTINTLLGLSEAARAGMPDVHEDQVMAMTQAFLRRQGGRIRTCADWGLLLLLLSEYGDRQSPVLESALGHLRAILDGAVRDLDMQDLAWATWGASAAARHNTPGSEALASRGFEIVSTKLLDPHSGLARHTTRLYRRDIVSFGSLAYFLRCAYEYASTFEDARAYDIFLNGARRTIGLQGPAGEWPWMIGVHAGEILDLYPVFSVHQDSMAMLFLLPAYDRGLSHAAAAIEQSLGWGFGANELSTNFYLSSPFYAYRSIERAERMPRLRRYLRGAGRVLPSRPTTSHPKVRINRECRSYHLGWILYAWAGRPETQRAPVV